MMVQQRCSRVKLRLTRALRLRFTSPKPPAAASQSPRTLTEIHPPFKGRRVSHEAEGGGQ
jgi:hypothetical protein